MVCEEIHKGEAASHFNRHCHVLWVFQSSQFAMDPTSAAYKDQLAHWGDDREPELLAASVILIVATCLAVPLRFKAQRNIKKFWEADNIIIFFAAVRLFRVLERLFSDWPLAQRFWQQL